MRKEKLLPLAAIIATVVVWGFSFLSIKVVLNVIPPMTMAFIRFFIASVLLHFIMRKIEPKTRLLRDDILLMALAGVIGVSLYFYFENNGVKLISASAASIIVSSVPILTLIADAIVFKSPMNKVKILSVFLSIAGVYLVVGGGLHGIELSGSGLGYLMMLGAALSWAVYSVITKPLFKKYSQLAIVYYQSVFGAIALAPFTLMEKASWDKLTSNIILNLLFLSIICSAAAYYFYVYAMDKLGIGESSVYLNLVPVVTVISSFFILGEVIKYNQLLGGLVVIVSVYLAGWPDKKLEAKYSM